MKKIKYLMPILGVTTVVGSTLTLAVGCDLNPTPVVDVTVTNTNEESAQTVIPFVVYDPWEEGQDLIAKITWHSYDGEKPRWFSYISNVKVNDKLLYEAIPDVNPNGFQFVTAGINTITIKVPAIHFTKTKNNVEFLVDLQESKITDDVVLDTWYESRYRFGDQTYDVLSTPAGTDTFPTKIYPDSGDYFEFEIDLSKWGGGSTWLKPDDEIYLIFVNSSDTIIDIYPNRLSDITIGDQLLTKSIDTGIISITSPNLPWAEDQYILGNYHFYNSYRSGVTVLIGQKHK